MAGKRVFSTCGLHHQCNDILIEDTGEHIHEHAPGGIQLPTPPSRWKFWKLRKRHQMVNQRKEADLWTKDN